MAAFDQAALDWLLAPQAPSAPSYDKATQKAQGTWMTNASKGGNLASDPEFLIANNLVSPGAYAPMTSYEDVDAPGLRQLTRMRSGSPYQQWVAAQLDAGRTSNQMLADIQGMIADPNRFASKGFTADDVGQILAELPPMQIEQQENNRGTGVWITDPEGRPDIRLVGDELRNFEQMQMSDPEYTIGPDGRPVKAVTEESEMMKNWLDAGYVSDPTATYDPYMFAPSGVTAESDAGIAKQFQDRQAGERSANTAEKAASAERMKAGEAYRRFLAGGGEQGIPSSIRAPQGDVQGLRGGGGGGDHGDRRERTPQRGGVADDLDRFAQDPAGAVGGFFGGLGGRISGIGGALDRNIGDPVESYFNGKELGLGQIGGGEEGAHIPYPMLRESGGGGGGADAGRRVGAAGLAAGPPTSFGRDMIGGGLANVAGLRGADAREAGTKARSAKEDRIDASIALNRARRAQAMREALVRQLASQGRSPGRDEVNARNAAIYGAWQG